MNPLLSILGAVAIVAIIRVLCCGDAALSVSVGGTTAPTISNLAITVTRE